MVESILRICRANPYKRILACAPSDAAADVLCDRLSRTLSPKQLFRLCWYQRVTASLPAKLRAYSSLVNDIFEVPNFKQLQTFQVIVCNCGTAGVLKTLQPSGANDGVQVLCNVLFAIFCSIFCNIWGNRRRLVNSFSLPSVSFLFADHLILRLHFSWGCLMSWWWTRPVKRSKQR